MKPLVQEKERAVFLRRKGLSYRDILKEIPVAKSTLSSWLKDLPLTKQEKVFLKHRQKDNLDKGRVKSATALRLNRLRREKVLYSEALGEFNSYISDPFFQIGVCLYWSEGTKRDSYFSFCNSDPDMMKMFKSWILKFLPVSESDFSARLYVHKPYIHEDCENFWSKTMDIPISQFGKTIIKPSRLVVKKRPNYKGCLRLTLRRSKNHLLKTIFWKNMLIEYYSKQM